MHLPAAYLHEAFSNRSGVPPDHFELYYRGKRLEGEAALASWGVEKDSAIEVKMRGRGGGNETDRDGQQPEASSSGASSSGASSLGEFRVQGTSSLGASSSSIDATAKLSSNAEAVAEKAPAAEKPAEKAAAEKAAAEKAAAEKAAAEMAAAEKAAAEKAAAEKAAEMKAAEKAAAEQAAAEKAARQDASLPRLLGDVDSLDEFEIEHFQRIAKYMKPNPRAIKRISSMYRLARLMVLSRARSLNEVEQKELLQRLLVWIVLCEQWPVHMAWSLQILEDMHQRQHLHQIQRGEENKVWLEDDPEKLSFDEFYHNHVKHHVFDVHQRHCHTQLRKSYQRIFSLEHDKEIFDCLIADAARINVGFELRVKHIGTLMDARNPEMLISYCTNLNPALVSLLSLIKSVPQSAADKRKAKDLVETGEHKHVPQQAPPAASEATLSQRQASDATQSQQQAPPSKIEAAESEIEAAEPETSSAVEQVVQQPDQAEEQAAKVKVSLPKDDKTGRDHIGTADYALCLASLIFGALETPCVVGIYAQWGTGKSFMMEKITAALKALQLEQVLFDELGRKYLDHLDHDENGEPAYLGDLRDLLTNENEEEQIRLMFKWLQMGMPELPRSAFKKVPTKGSRKVKGRPPARLDSKYFDLHEAGNEQLDITPIWLLCRLVARFFVAICKPILVVGNQCARFVHGSACIIDTSSAPMLHQLTQARAARRRRRQAGDDDDDDQAGDDDDDDQTGEARPCSYDYHFIWWNAWLYSGSDNLWAGLIKALHEAVEERYGAPYVRRCR